MSDKNTSEKKTQIEFKFKVGEEEKDFVVKKPNYKQINESKKVSNRVFSEAVTSGALTRSELDKHLRDRGLWDDARQAKYTELQEAISAKEKILRAGGINLSAAKKIAFEMQELRAELRVLIADRMDTDKRSADGQADDAAFDYLTSATLFDSNDKPYWKDYNDYLERRGDDDLAATAAGHLAQLVYGLSESFERNLPENKFLIEQGFMNEELRLIDSKGRLIDRSGRLINKDGRFINEAGELVNVDGDLVTEDGDLIIETKPFIVDVEVYKPVKTIDNSPPAIETVVESV